MMENTGLLVYVMRWDEVGFREWYGWLWMWNLYKRIGMRRIWLVRAMDCVSDGMYERCVV